ncbi:type II toxin-antitoxin system RelE/ParE family toxin [Zunongwangia sp. H14]|uniref:type II toxin-antitoxin system RelE/ParE family toxin n=1 Tax=Zunongwangia sp. H14 TaxID=3240792 RepID=UPI00356195D5
MGKAIIWTSQADAELSQAFLELLEQSESIETTARIITEIYESASILSTNPEIYKLDTIKTNNPGNIRAYEKHTYRISYLIEEEAIYILRVRYARKEPLEY